MAAILVPNIDALIQQELPAARRGDQAAYGRIVAPCQNTVTAVALAITRDVGASEDIAQEAFLNAWQHLDRLHSPDSFLPWLRQIARNLARDHLRKYRDQPLDGPNAELAMAMAADPGPHPMQQLLEDEHETAAAELIAALPEDSRETLLLFYREGQSSQQVAALLGITDAAVRKRLSRARQLVRDELLVRFGEFARSSAPSAAFTSTVAIALAALSNPASAATIAGAATAGTVTAGSGLLGKGLFGAVGAGGMIGGALAGGALAAHLTRKHLLAFAETIEEHDRILRDYWLYMVVTLVMMLFAFVVVVKSPSFIVGFGAAVLTELASLWTLLKIRNTLIPLMRRDAERDPNGHKKRYRAYDHSYGPTAIVVSAVIYLFGMAVLHVSVHSGPEAAAATTKMLLERLFS